MGTTDYKTDFKTVITIHCKDSSKRVIITEGYRTIHQAQSLGRDLEGVNFKYVTITN